MTSCLSHDHMNTCTACLHVASLQHIMGLSLSLFLSLFSLLGQGTLPQHQAEQLFKMAKHCLERGETIYLTAKKEQRPLALFRLATPSPTPSPTQVQAPPTSAGLLISDSASTASNSPQMRQMRSGTMPGRLTGIPPSRASTWPEKLAIGAVGNKFRSLRTSKGRGRGTGNGSSEQIDGPESGPTNQLQTGR